MGLSFLSFATGGCVDERGRLSTWVEEQGVAIQAVSVGACGLYLCFFFFGGRTEGFHTWSFVFPFS